MKYIKTLGLNQFLNPDSLKGIKIGEIKLGLYEVYYAKPKELLSFLNIILKNEDNIGKSTDLINLIIRSSCDRSLEFIRNKKEVDPYLEKIISYSIDESVKYMRFIKEYKTNSNFKINENQLIENDSSKLILEYIRKIKNKRFPEAEHIILKNINDAIEYCYFYMREPWKELEKKIEDTNIKTFYFDYIYKVIVPYYKRNFPRENLRSLIQKNYPLYEKQIMIGIYQKENVYPIYTYAKEVIGGRWIEFESMIENKINSGEIFYGPECDDFFYYMLKIYPGRWKIAEPYLIDLKKGYPKLNNLQDYINDKVIPEYKKNLETFEDLEKYKDEFNMWDKLLDNEIVFIYNPVYMFIKLRDLINHRDKQTVKKIFKEYFPLNYSKNIENRI
jgi:hypothetical protein